MLLRLHCRVTPANKELHEHLLEIPADYRSKRLVELASMMCMMLGRNNLGLTGMPQHADTAADRNTGRKRKSEQSSPEIKASIPPQVLTEPVPNNSETQPALTPTEDKTEREMISTVSQDDTKQEASSPRKEIKLGIPSFLANALDSSGNPGTKD